jgi:hypothetical protein
MAKVDCVNGRRSAVGCISPAASRNWRRVFEPLADQQVAEQGRHRRQSRHQPQLLHLQPCRTRTTRALGGAHPSNQRRTRLLLQQPPADPLTPTQGCRDRRRKRWSKGPAVASPNNVRVSFHVRSTKRPSWTWVGAAPSPGEYRVAVRRLRARALARPRALRLRLWKCAPCRSTAPHSRPRGYA